MDVQEQREFLLLSEVDRDSEVTQRSLATKLGVALGLTNLYLKRLARKGHIKITTIPRHRVRYLLTPRGMAEKTRLTYRYMQYSLTYYRDMRERLKMLLADASRKHVKRIVVYGTGELAELAYLSLREMNLTLVGFVAGEEMSSFLAYPVWPIEALAEWDYDAILIAELDGSVTRRLARQGISKEKILVVAP